MLQFDNCCCCNFQGFVVAFFAPLYLQEHVSILWSFRRLTKAHMSEPTQGSSIVTQCSNLCTYNNKQQIGPYVPCGPYGSCEPCEPRAYCNICDLETFVELGDPVDPLDSLKNT